jgi:hypothetical protein
MVAPYTSRIRACRGSENLDVIVPHLLDTGVAKRLAEGGFEVNLDCACCVESYEDHQIRMLRWKEHRIDAEFLFIVKAWKVPFRKYRRLVLQCHKIRRDGSWGRRVVLREIVNGKVIR